jgi:hypothetical protein
MKKQFENVDDRECELWGNCSCFWTLELWGRLLQDENKTWFMDELEWGETTLLHNASWRISTGRSRRLCRRKDGLDVGRVTEVRL